MRRTRGYDFKTKTYVLGPKKHKNSHISANIGDRGILSPDSESSMQISQCLLKALYQIFSVIHPGTQKARRFITLILPIRLSLQLVIYFTSDKLTRKRKRLLFPTFLRFEVPLLLPSETGTDSSPSMPPVTESTSILISASERVLVLVKLSLAAPTPIHSRRSSK